MTVNVDRPTTGTERVSLSELGDLSRVRVFEGEPQTMKLALEAGERVPPHQHPDRQIVFHLIEGRLRLTLGDGASDLEAGELVRFDGDQDVSLNALERSTAIVVLATRADG
jgi:quercetin dioxygenase-like cupin family protein